MKNEQLEIVTCRSKSTSNPSMDTLIIYCPKTSFAVMPATRHFPKLINLVSGRKYDITQTIWDDLKGYFAIVKWDDKNETTRHTPCVYGIEFVVTPEITTQKCFDVFCSEEIFTRNTLSDIKVTEVSYKKVVDKYDSDTLIPGEKICIL